jgi:hypothetical protein
MDLTRGGATQPAPADSRREPAEAAARSAASGTVLDAAGPAIPVGAVAGPPALGNGKPTASRYYAQAMEITTILPVRELIIASQRAAAIVSQPRRSRHAIRVVLTRVGHGAMDGAAAAFAAQLHQQIHAADPAAACSQAAAGTQAANGETAI